MISSSSLFKTRAAGVGCWPSLFIAASGTIVCGKFLNSCVCARWSSQLLEASQWSLALKLWSARRGEGIYLLKHDQRYNIGCLHSMIRTEATLSYDTTSRAACYRQSARATPYKAVSNHALRTVVAASGNQTVHHSLLSAAHRQR
jgi:hypothetical protein